MVPNLDTVICSARLLFSYKYNHTIDGVNGVIL